MDYNAFGWLTQCPTNDCNYTTALAKATDDELARAITFLKERPNGNKGRMAACEREARRREGKARP